MKKQKITERNYIKAHRKANREEEIVLHGWPAKRRFIHATKKIYNRKRMKAGIDPAFFAPAPIC